MILSKTHIEDCVVFKPSINHDHRGSFIEIYKYSTNPSFDIKQSNCSISKKGVLRGIHRTPYAKFVTCISGSIYDVCVDLRENSPTYGDHFGIELNSDNLYCLLIPPYCGHAFLALTDSVVLYHQSEEYQKLYDETYCYKSYNIDWPISTQPIMSLKDTNICN